MYHICLSAFGERFEKKYFTIWMVSALLKKGDVISSRSSILSREFFYSIKSLL